MILGRRRNGESEVTLERPEEVREIVAEIERLGAENRDRRDPEIEQQIRRMRHLAGIKLLGSAQPDPSFIKPARKTPKPNSASGVPEITSDQLTPSLLRGSILKHGCLLVRGLIDPQRASAMAEGIERAVEVRQELRDGDSEDELLYQEMEPEDGYLIYERPWVEQGGGLLAVDSPPLLFDMLTEFERAGLRSVIEAYLGDHALISAQKCTLRKATPEVSGAWHQDGSFLGEVRSLNVWIALSRCGDVAPGMDLVPQRLERLIETGEEELANQISDHAAANVAGKSSIVRPIFEPGDALLFDHLFLHQTGSDPEMPNTRYAIESWFFGVSGYPKGYAPIAP